MGLFGLFISSTGDKAAVAGELDLGVEGTDTSFELLFDEWLPLGTLGLDFEGKSRSLRSLRLASDVNELLNCPECLKGEDEAFLSGTATKDAIFESVLSPELA